MNLNKPSLQKEQDFSNELKTIDFEDLHFWILDVEKSYNIEFEDGDLSIEMTFGEYIDAIINKIKLENSDECTTQHLFYKVRNSLSKQFNIEHKTIVTNSCLDEIIPSKKRISILKDIESSTGIKFITHLQSPVDNYLIFTALISFLIAVPWWFACDFMKLGNLYYSFPCITFVICVIGMENFYKIKSNFNEKTIRDIIEYSVSRDYLKNRKNPETYNRKESEKLLVSWFCENMAINKQNVFRHSKFI
ncbi:hypothetical protein O2K51_13520 [Apibacter raozihei]|uniref:hypothetical protein n=1 Tax=Apibacter raozihei TaxID=2500547 RepID=UPI000FE3BCA9|nr:hypothetical protein [Apibacter raozihei]